MDLSRKLSVWYVVAIPIVAGISTLNFEIAGFNYTGFLWAILLPIGLYLLVLNRISGTDPGGILPCWPWILWCCFICFSLMWGEAITRRNIQEVLQYSMPLVVGLLAASAVRTHAELRQLLIGFALSLGLLLAFAAAYATQLIDQASTGTTVRGAALAAALVGCVFLAEFPQRKLIPIAGWAACLLITTLTSSRMATLALLIAPMLHPHFKGRFLWKVTATAIVFGVGLFIFNTQTFQEHFFAAGHGTLEDVYAGDFKDHGRFEAWEAMWNEAWNRPLLGTGVGASFDYVPTVWEDMNHIHNDYLRIFFEFGLVGITLFVAVCVWQLLAIRRQILCRGDGLVQTTFTAAWLGFWVLLISCLTDNTIVYNVLFTNPLFALTGAAYGVAWAERRGGCISDDAPLYNAAELEARQPLRRRRQSTFVSSQSPNAANGTVPEAG